MFRERLNLRLAAEHVHLDANELRHVAQRGEIEAQRRGDDWFFEHRALDEWAQRNLLSATPRALREQHRVMMDENRRAHLGSWRVSDLFLADGIDLNVPAKAKAGILRDMTDLADRTGRAYDPEALFRELVAREEAASTAIGAGIALLHPRFHDPYLFAESFIAYGRSLRPVFFGAPDGQATRHFFLVCSTDHEAHLHILARLAMLAHGTDFVERLDAVQSADEALAAARAVAAGIPTVNPASVRFTPSRTPAGNSAAPTVRISSGRENGCGAPWRSSRQLSFRPGSFADFPNRHHHPP